MESVPQHPMNTNFISQWGGLPGTSLSTGPNSISDTTKEIIYTAEYGHRNLSWSKFCQRVAFFINSGSSVQQAQIFEGLKGYIKQCRRKCVCRSLKLSHTSLFITPSASVNKQREHLSISAYGRSPVKKNRNYRYMHPQHNRRERRANFRHRNYQIRD